MKKFYLYIWLHLYETMVERTDGCICILFQRQREDNTTKKERNKTKPNWEEKTKFGNQYCMYHTFDLSFGIVPASISEDIYLWMCFVNLGEWKCHLFFYYYFIILSSVCIRLILNNIFFANFSSIYMSEHCCTCEV
jgi:hypothetical protein